MKRHNYKKLKIWKLGLEISKDVSDILTDFPKHERFDLISQISSCSISIPSNIAEGSAGTDKSFSHFINISLGGKADLLDGVNILLSIQLTDKLIRVRLKIL